MANLSCSFKAGRIITNEPRRISAKRQFHFLGNGWRGVLVITGAALSVYGLWDLGVIILSLAFLWSFIDNLIRSWGNIYTQHKVLFFLDRGRTQEALEICAEPEPKSQIWWRYLNLLFLQNRWQEAAQYLEDLEPGKERDYLLALVSLGQNQPQTALRLCPARPEGSWQTLKAEALFQMKEWQKVLAVLRGSSLKGNTADRLEHAWLKGGSYYFLKQYKPAVKLLRQVTDLADPEYAGAAEWVKQALVELERVP